MAAKNKHRLYNEYRRNAAPSLVTAHLDPEAVRIDQERRRSSAASRHVPKARKGSRAAQRRAAIAFAG